MPIVMQILILLLNSLSTDLQNFCLIPYVFIITVFTTLLCISWERLSGFSSNLELEVPHPEEICTENFVCFCSGSFKLQMHENGIFFTPVKYTLVCRTPKFSWFLGPHDTLPCVLIVIVVWLILVVSHWQCLLLAFSAIVSTEKL